MLLQMRRYVVQTGHVADFLRVQRFGFQQGVCKGVERAAVRRQHPVGLAVAFLDDPPDLGIDQLGSGLAVWLMLERRRQTLVLRRDKADRPERIAHSPAQDHVPRDLGDLLKIVFGTGRADAIHELFGRATSECADDARPQVVLGITGSIVDGS